MMTKFTVNEAAMSKLLKGTEGPVARHLQKRAKRVEQFARTNVNNPRGGARKPWRRSGDLYNSISMSRPAISQGELAVAVGSVAGPFAHPHHDPHYPILLEKGGTARFTYKRGSLKGKKAAKRYRYQWLHPALESEFGSG